MRFLISILIAGWVAFVPGARAQEKATVLEVGLLIDGSGGAPVKDAVVVIEGKKVKAAGKRGEVKIPQSAKVIQARDKTAFPGLLDSHVHYKEWQGELYLNHGVTTALAIGSDTIEWIVAQKEGTAKGKIVGPRILAAGPHLNSPAPGERATRNVRDVLSRRRSEIEVNTAEEAKKVVRELHALGADIIKIYEESTPEVIKGASEEANRLGLPAGGHSIDIFMSGGNGFNFVEHSHAIVASSIKDGNKRMELHKRRTARRGGMSTPEFHFYAEPENFDEIVGFMVGKQIHWGPTLATTWRGVTSKRAQFRAREVKLLKTPGLVYVPPYFTANMENYFDGIEKIKDQELLKRIQVGYEKLSDFVRRFATAGGKIHTGSDPNSVLPAESIHTEMELLVDMGLMPMQAILASTKNPAAMVHREKELGVIREGSFADIVVVEGNPLEDIAKTRNIKMVFKDGQAVRLGYNKDFKNPVPRPDPDRPAPEIDEINPKIVTEGAGPVTLKVTGENFLSTAVVTLDGKRLPSKIESKPGSFPDNFERFREVTATIDPKLIQRAGTYRINVVHDGLGGAVSNPQPLMVKFK
jgi:hypothetical protein